MTSATIQRSFPQPDLAVLTLDMPNKGANVLSRSVMEELDGHLRELESRTDLIGLIVISGKPSQFIAGADLREFVASLSIPREKAVELCRAGQQLFARLSKTPFVTVAAIDGTCVGGGAELASWCDRRILTDKPQTQFGFPEIKLGLYPGWGGTVRAPRIVGTFNAVEMITSGESISASAAYKMGWASDLVPADRLLDAAIALVRDEHRSQAFRQDRKRWEGPVDISETELGFLGAAASGYIQQQTDGHYPAPLAALETILSGVSMDSESACKLEANGMAELFGSPINAALLNVFFLMDGNKKDRGVDQPDLTPQKIEQVTVLGAGIMGVGIAAANLKRDIHVTLSDVSPDAVERGRALAIEEVAFDRETKKKDVDRAIQYASKLDTSTDDKVLAAAGLVIEAVIEKESIKTELLRRIERHMSPTAVLATNTSTIPVTRLAAELAHPERFCGIHFFNPVRKMKLVEVIRGQKTNDQTVATAVAYAKGLGKMPVVVNDGPGFLVNRLLLPYMQEALQLVEEGNAFEAIDKAAKRFGMPMGPIALYDMVGLDTAVFAGKILCEAFPERFQGSRILPAIVETGRLGQKSGRGFYSYENKKRRAQADPEIAALVAPHQQSTNARLSTEQLIHRLFLPMLVEGTRILEEGLVRNARDVDIGMIFGTGFPPFRGGLLFWGDTLGAARVIEMLQPYAKLGKRYEPTELLKRCARDDLKLYQVT